MSGIQFKVPPKLERRGSSADEPTCAKCEGLGKERIDEWTYRLCACAMRRVVRQRLGDLANAAAIERTPLYDERQGVDMTQANLWLTGEWGAVASHLRNALAWKTVRAYPQVFRFRMTTDEALRRGYFATADKYAEAPSESMHEMISGYHLVIIRLGFLGYGNKAMPGILKEALMLREVEGRPTWLIDSPHEPFAKGHMAWDEAVGGYVERRFQRGTMSEVAP